MTHNIKFPIVHTRLGEVIDENDVPIFDCWAHPHEKAGDPIRQAEANAREIVRRANAYDELVQAIHDLKNQLQSEVR
jgi:hypothetical protein